MPNSYWITEAAGGYGQTIEVTDKLYSVRSRFQKIEIFETAKLGRLLMLDGIIQLTESDEFVYHEMMANVPFYAHSGIPRRALVIGGGDGGVLRELGRHPELEQLDICEIDGEVIAAAREFLPSTACGFDDPRVKIHVADGMEFIRGHKDEYDLIIVDSTDPVGPGEPLFGAEFYAGLKRALRPAGVIATQSESPFLLPEVVKRLNSAAQENFRYVGYSGFAVPTYPTGMIGACVASNGREVAVPDRTPPSGFELRYYTPEVHAASFVRPGFVKLLLD